VTEPAPPGAIRVEVVYAVPDRYWSQRLLLPAGTTVAQALVAAAMERTVGEALDVAGMAVFSRPVQLTSVLRDGDRLELLRPLASDPKQSRRTRAVGSGPRRR
jgi:putative ubiquitin-RnfH superfamily antitoxin RatB of RatAB toxin-antitoxin module